MDNLLAEYEGRLARAVSRDEVVQFTDQLPTLPYSAGKLLRLVDNPNSAFDQVEEAVAGDAALATALLRLANSAGFAQQRQVTTVPQALTLVGLRNLKTLVLAQALTRLNRSPGQADRLVRDNSVATALLARGLAQRIGRRDADDFYLFGVLHCLGQFVLLAHDKTRPLYPRVLERIREHQTDYVTAELAELGFTHPLVGALVANRWDFPAELAQIMLRYHAPFEGLDTDLDFKIGLVKLADGVAHASGLGHPEGHPVSLPSLAELGAMLDAFGPQPEKEVLLAVKELQHMFELEAQWWPPP